MPAPPGNPEGTPAKFKTFGNFHVDLAAGELRKRGLKLRLAGQPFEILRLLLEHPGQLVSREELRGRLWANETFVDFDHGLNAAINKLREILGDSSERPRFIETLPRRGYRFIAQVQDGLAAPLPLPARAARKRIRSLAILPFKNLSCDTGQEYFVDGMTEALITSLAKISALRVISRTSVMRYKEARKSLSEVAQELNVDSLVQGSVLRVRGRVRITAQLLDAGSDTHIWAESYERDIRDVLGLQSEVAQAIAQEIRVRITQRERKRLRQASRIDPKAHEAYLLGRYYWNKRTFKGLNKSLEYYQRALDLDAAYALAYAGIADSYVVLGSAVYEWVSPSEVMPKAWAAAQEALKIDKSLGEAHATLAFVNWLYKRDWDAAEKEFQLALELNPGYSTAHHWYAVYLAQLGRPKEALAEIERARELDPLSLQINTGVVQVLYFGRAYDQAVEQALRTIELDPNFATAHLMLALAYLQIGRRAEALAEGEKAALYSGRSPASLACIGGCCAALGRTDEATAMITGLEDLSEERHVSPHLIGFVYACLGDKAHALAYLERAYADGSTYLAALKTDPSLDSLRSDPRFRELQRRVGLPS
jgi:TolB-like protein/Flp pilus assembly protein TadD